jgi:hypothetical protein
VSFNLKLVSGAYNILCGIPSPATKIASGGCDRNEDADVFLLASWSPLLCTDLVRATKGPGFSIVMYRDYLDPEPIFVGHLVEQSHEISQAELFFP